MISTIALIVVCGIFLAYGIWATLTQIDWPATRQEFKELMDIYNPGE